MQCRDAESIVIQTGTTEYSLYGHKSVTGRWVLN